MKIIRYSIEGFKPQYQSHHLEDIKYHLNDFDISVYPKHLKMSIRKIHERKVSFYQENYEDFQYGIWAFIKGYKVPCWEAEISDDVIVYDVNWEKKILITDKLCRSIWFLYSQTKIRHFKTDSIEQQFKRRGLLNDISIKSILWRINKREGYIFC